MKGKGIRYWLSYEDGCAEERLDYHVLSGFETEKAMLEELARVSDCIVEGSLMVIKGEAIEVEPVEVVKEYKVKDRER